MNDILLLGQIYYKTEDELKMYENYIESLKKFGYKIMIMDSSPEGLLFNYSKLCDYYIYDKENKLFDRKPFGYLDFTINGNVYELFMECGNVGEHELNILYQNTKSFNFAKLLGYKYILRLECDAIMTDEDFIDIKTKINDCISSNKKALLLYLVEQEYLGLHIGFWQIDWYLEKFGNILSQKDWEDFLVKNNFTDNNIETVMGKHLKKDIDQFNIIENKILFQKAFRYKETKRFFDSDVIIDFFKSGDALYFATNNMTLSKYPEKLILTQYTPNGVLTNQITDPLKVLSWILIDQNFIYVELNVNDKIYKLERSKLLSIKNRLVFK